MSRDTAERDFEKPCQAWAACCCDNAGDGHCWYCGFPKEQHPVEAVGETAPQSAPSQSASER
jgi:hypothetical protein